MDPPPNEPTPNAAGGVSVVVPVYHSQETLRPLVERLSEVLPSVADEYELILVNDGSTDGSWEVVRELSERNDWIRGIDLARNFGQHNALLCGIRAARLDIVVTMDDDLQNPPEELGKLVAKVREGNDVVYGVSRELRHGFLRGLASWLTKFTLRHFLDAHIGPAVSAFRAFRREVARAFEDYHLEYVSIDALLAWGTQRYSWVEVEHARREIGTSNYTLRKLFVHAFNLTTGFSVVPLRLASLVGLAFTLFGVILFAFVVIRFLVEGSPVPGFPFLASTIAIFSGAQLFALGIIGEYLGRVHARSLGKPPYLIRREARSARA